MPSYGKASVYGYNDTAYLSHENIAIGHNNVKNKHYKT